MLILCWRDSNAEGHIWCRGSVQSTLVRALNDLAMGMVIVAVVTKKSVIIVPVCGEHHRKELRVQDANAHTKGAPVRGVQVRLINCDEPHGALTMSLK